MIATDIRGWMGHEFSRHLSYNWRKTPQKFQPGKLTWLGIKPRPARCEATILPLDYSGDCLYHKKNTSQIFLCGSRTIIIQYVNIDSNHDTVLSFESWLWLKMNTAVIIYMLEYIIKNSSSVCYAQGQVFHCKLRHQGCSSAQRQVFHCKLRNQDCSFTRN